MSLVNVNVPKELARREARRKRSSGFGATARFAQIFQNHQEKFFRAARLIIHEVADYAAWKKFSDRAAGIRREAGERSPTEVLRYENEPGESPFFAWTSIAARKSVLRIAGLGQNPRRSRA